MKRFLRGDTGGMTRGGGWRLVAAAAVTAVAVAALAACSTEAADQKVIDRLSKLDVMTVPAGATELSRTSVKGGGNIAIRTSSSVTLVYATPKTPLEVKKDVHSRLDSRWDFRDSLVVPPGAWG